MDHLVFLRQKLCAFILSPTYNIHKKGILQRFFSHNFTVWHSIDSHTFSLISFRSSSTFLPSQVKLQYFAWCAFLWLFTVRFSLSLCVLRLSLLIFFSLSSIYLSIRFFDGGLPVYLCVSNILLVVVFLLLLWLLSFSLSFKIMSLFPMQHSQHKIHLNKSFIQAYKYWNYNSNCRIGAVCVLARARATILLVVWLAVFSTRSLLLYIYAFNFDQIGKNTFAKCHRLGPTESTLDHRDRNQYGGREEKTTTHETRYIFNN